MLPRNSIVRVTLSALTALVGGCFTVGDLAHVGAVDAAVATADGAPFGDVVPVSPGHATMASDASLPELDATASCEPNVCGLLPDGRMPHKTDYLPPTQVEEPRLACDAAHPCELDELCAPDGLCLPRCETHGVCVAIASPRAIDQVWVIDGITYLKLASMRDPLGNDMMNAELQRLEDSGQLTFLANNHDFEGLQSDGAQLYWRSKGKVWRMPKSGSVAPEPLYSTLCNFLLLEGNQLALLEASKLSIGSSNGQAPLRPIADLPTEYQDCSPLVYSDQRVFWVRGHTIVASSLTTEAERTYGFGDTSFLALMPPNVYSRSADGQQFFRHDLRDPTLTEMVTPLDDRQRPAASLQMHGDWVYRVSSSNSHESFYLELERWSLLQLGTKQTIADGFRPPSAYPIVDTANSNIFTGPGASSFAVTPTHLLVLANHYPVADGAPRSSLLYRLPLPAAL